MLASFGAAIAALADSVLEGAEDVDVQLSGLLEGVPDSVRAEIVKRFRAVLEELQQEKGREIDLASLEPKEQRRIRKERERLLIAHFLSEKTLEKIRRAMLFNPAMFRQVMEVGEELQQKGVFLGRERVAEVASPQPVKTPGHDKGEGRER